MPARPCCRLFAFSSAVILLGAAEPPTVPAPPVSGSPEEGIGIPAQATIPGLALTFSEDCAANIKQAVTAIGKREVGNDEKCLVGFYPAGLAVRVYQPDGTVCGATTGEALEYVNVAGQCSPCVATWLKPDRKCRPTQAWRYRIAQVGMPGVKLDQPHEVVQLSIKKEADPTGRFAGPAIEAITAFLESHRDHPAYKDSPWDGMQPGAPFALAWAAILPGKTVAGIVSLTTVRSPEEGPIPGPLTAVYGKTSKVLSDLGPWGDPPTYGLRLGGSKYIVQKVAWPNSGWVETLLLRWTETGGWTVESKDYRYSN